MLFIDNLSPLDIPPFPPLRAIKLHSILWRNLAVVWADWAVVDVASSVADDGVGGGCGVRRGIRLNRTKLWRAARSTPTLGFAIQRHQV